MPWGGYFYKMNAVDTFVFLDNVQYSSGGADAIINRNKIKTPNGELLLTVPVVKSKEKLNINQTQISYEQNWADKHLKSLLHNYKKAPFFDEVYQMIENILLEKYPHLAALNIAYIKAVCGYLDIKTEMVCSSDLITDGLNKSELLISIIQQCGCDTYLSGNGGKKYMELDLFAQAGIAVQFTGFSPKPYNQLYGEFLPAMSMTDILFNCGKSSLELIS
jgi:hypothetical protein